MVTLGGPPRGTKSVISPNQNIDLTFSKEAVNKYSISLLFEIINV